jgi:hypothetical protein
MVTTILASILALFASCGTPAGEPDDRRPTPPDPPEAHFCCNDVGVNGSGQGTGDGCVMIGPETVNACNRVLTCGEQWIKRDGVVTCL